MAVTPLPLVTLGNLLPIPVQQFFDENGAVLADGQIFTYAADGVTPKSTYQNAAQTILQPQPIQLDGTGRPQGSTGIYGSGNYVFAVFDQFGVQQYTQPTADTTTSLGVTALGEQLIQQETTAQMQALLNISSSLSLVPWGVPLPFAGPTANVPSGWVLCFGQAVSRSAYPNLFSAIGTSWGDGDGATTFNLPDLRGRIWAGVDAMGGTPANNLTSASLGGSGAILAAVGGNELPQTDTITCGVTQIPHGHGVTYGQGSGGTVSPTWNVNVNLGNNVANGNYNTGTADANITVTATSSFTGTSQNVQPTAVGNWIMQLG